MNSIDTKQCWHETSDICLNTNSVPTHCLGADTLPRCRHSASVPTHCLGADTLPRCRHIGIASVPSPAPVGQAIYVATILAVHDRRLQAKSRACRPVCARLSVRVSLVYACVPCHTMPYRAMPRVHACVCVRACAHHSHRVQAAQMWCRGRE